MQTYSRNNVYKRNATLISHAASAPNGIAFFYSVVIHSLCKRVRCAIRNFFVLSFGPLFWNSFDHSHPSIILETFRNNSMSLNNVAKWLKHISCVFESIVKLKTNQFQRESCKKYIYTWKLRNDRLPHDFLCEVDSIEQLFMFTPETLEPHSLILSTWCIQWDVIVEWLRVLFEWRKSSRRMRRYEVKCSDTIENHSTKWLTI